MALALLGAAAAAVAAAPLGAVARVLLAVVVLNNL
jgi:hypothetical protein